MEVARDRIHVASLIPRERVAGGNLLYFGTEFRGLEDAVLSGAIPCCSLIDREWLFAHDTLVTQLAGTAPHHRRREEVAHLNRVRGPRRRGCGWCVTRLGRDRQR